VLAETAEVASAPQDVVVGELHRRVAERVGVAFIDWIRNATQVAPRQ